MSKEIDESLGVIENTSKHSSTAKVGNPKLNITQEVMLQSQEDWGDANKHVERDYEYQRQNFYNLVERGTDAVEGILELAKESDHPRAYEVAGNLIKQVAEVTEKLGDLQEKMRKLKEVPNNAPKNVTNALFVGSTAELQKMLKEK
jgi:hypothetical protein